MRSTEVNLSELVKIFCLMAWTHTVAWNHSQWCISDRRYTLTPIIYDSCRKQVVLLFPAPSQNSIRRDLCKLWGCWVLELHVLQHWCWAARKDVCRWLCFPWSSDFWLERFFPEVRLMGISGLPFPAAPNSCRFCKSFPSPFRNCGLLRHL